MAEWFVKITLGDMIDRAAERFRDREALFFAAQRWSFSALQADCDRAARGLMPCGIRPGDKVSLWLPNCPEWLHLLFAVMKIGAILVPINTRFRTHDLDYVLRQSESTTLITTDTAGPIGYLDMVRALVPELHTAHPVQGLRTAAFPALQRVIVVSLQSSPGTWAWPEEELLAFCRGKIASFKIPRYVLSVKEYPMTASGKVQKFKLRDMSLQTLGLQS